MSIYQPSYLKKWIEQDRILLYQFRAVTKAEADAWYDDMVATFRSWQDAKRPLHLLLDLRQSSAIVSSQALMRARQASHENGNVKGRTAVLTGSALAAQVIGALVRSGLAPSVRERNVFTHEPSAIAWLLQT